MLLPRGDLARFFWLEAVRIGSADARWPGSRVEDLSPSHGRSGGYDECDEGEDGAHKLPSYADATGRGTRRLIRVMESDAAPVRGNSWVARVSFSQ